MPTIGSAEESNSALPMTATLGGTTAAQPIAVTLGVATETSSAQAVGAAVAAPANAGYHQAVLALNPYWYLKLNEPVGTSGANSLVALGQVTEPADVFNAAQTTFGQPGLIPSHPDETCVEFAGSGSLWGYIQPSAIPDLQETTGATRQYTQLTINVRVQPVSLPQGTSYIIDLGPGRFDPDVHLSLVSDGTTAYPFLSARINDSEFQFSATPATIEVGTAYTIGLRIDSNLTTNQTTVAIFIDGVKTFTQTVDGLLNQATVNGPVYFPVNRANNSHRGFLGRMQGFAAWRSPLTDANMLALHNAATGAAAPDPDPDPDPEPEPEPVANNDNIADATAIVLTDGVFVSAAVDNSAKTTESGEPKPHENQGNKTAWWKMTISGKKTFDFDTKLTQRVSGSSSVADTQLAVYRGTGTIGSLVKLAGDSDSGGSTGGPQYSSEILGLQIDGSASPVQVYVQVGAWDGEPNLLYKLRVTDKTPTGGGTDPDPGTDPVVDSGPIALVGQGDLELDDEFLVLTEMELIVQDPTIDRAPTVVVASLQGASPDVMVDFTIDGHAVTSVIADSDGSLFYLSITVSATLGTQGAHTLRAAQTTAAGTKTAEASFTVNRAPAMYPVNMNTDAAPIFVAEAVVNAATKVQRWVFQDLLAAAEGGIGSWVMPINPKEMGSPHFERTTTARHTTAATGRFHIFETGTTPKEWTFAGYCPTEAMAKKLAAYRALNRRFYIIDHHNRAWIVAATNLDIVPRLRHIYNGDVTDWGSDYTMTVTVLRQDWRVPQ